MYEEHWGLAERPFENRIDHKYYYPAETHQAALLKLHYAIENRRAAAVLCGPGGMGKSLMLESLRNQLADDFRPLVHVVFPTMSGEQLVRYVVNQVAPSSDEPSTEVWSDLARFESFLSESIEAGRHPVIMVDEAQLLEQNNSLEPLRLLLNVCAHDADGESAWTLVLAGQPTLLSHVERYHALDERLSVKCMLNRLTQEETEAYIQHRIRAAGGGSDQIFAADAIERIHVFSQGIPRKINRLCDLSLMVGYAEDLTNIASDTIDNVNNDLAPPVVL